MYSHKRAGSFLRCSAGGGGRYRPRCFLPFALGASEVQGTAYGRKDKMPTLLGNITIAMRDGAHVNDAFKLFVLADGHAGE